MRKILIYIILVVGFMSACSEDFLNTTPSTDLGQRQAEKTVKGLNGILDGIHYMLYSYDWSGTNKVFGTGQMAISARLDFLGDDLINTRPAYLMGAYRYKDTKNPYGELPYKVWDFYYTIILHANKVIKNTVTLEMSDDDRNSLLGEAYAFRAWAYHNLVQLYGKRYEKGGDNSNLGVIIRTEDKLTDQLPRSTVAEVYQYIDENINKALKYLEKAPDKGIKNTIRYSTACGIAARIALTKSDWKNAEKYAEEAIAKSGAKLEGKSLLNGFNDYNASEWMWGYTQTATQDFFYGSFYALYSYNYKGYNKGLRIAVNRTIYDAMGKKDVRRKWWVCLDQGDEIPADAFIGYFPGGSDVTKAGWEITGQPIKYKSKEANSTKGDLLIMRLAEMYYIKAEAEARQNKDVEAQETLNDIMVTRDEDYQTSVSGDDLLKEIMRNKRVDLWMEGQRFFDMKRLGIIPNRLDAANYKYLEGAALDQAKRRNSGEFVKEIPSTLEDKGWQFAIPYDELKGNKLCEQNPL